MPLFDEKQIVADIQSKKVTTLDLSNIFMKDGKAEIKNITTLNGHNRYVTALTVLPDGRITSGSWDNTLKLWDCGLRPLPWSAMRGVLMQLEHCPTVSKVNLQHTALNDASVAELATIFHTNRTVTELNLCNTEVTAKKAETFYKLLPLDHPLRQGLRHEAIVSIYCKDILGNFFSQPLITLLLNYLSKEDVLQSLAKQNSPLSSASGETNSSQQPLLRHPAALTQTPLAFFNTSSPSIATTLDCKPESLAPETPAKKL